MNIRDIFEEQIEVTDLNAAIEQANQSLGFARNAWYMGGGFPNVKFTERNGVTHTLVAYHSHMLKELIKLLPPIEKPEWLLICGFTTCYAYCDTSKEVNRDYKPILRLFYNPLRIEITGANKRAYPEVLELAKQQLKRLQVRVNEPLEVSASGQVSYRSQKFFTTDLALTNGRDVITLMEDNKVLLPCLCMTCGVRNDFSHPSGYCQNNHDNWLEYYDVIHKNESFEQAVKNSGLTEKKFINQFMDKYNAFIQQAP